MCDIWELAIGYYTMVNDTPLCTWKTAVAYERIDRTKDEYSLVVTLGNEDQMKTLAPASFAASAMLCPCFTSVSLEVVSQKLVTPNTA